MIQTFKKLCVGLCCILAVALPFVFGGCSDEDDFVPELPEPLSEELEAQVKQDYYDAFVVPSELWSGAIKNPSSIIIMYYWGTYNGCVVLTTECDVWLEQYITIPYMLAGIEIPGVGFGVWVWHESDFYDLDGAYEQGFLTQKNIRNISYLLNNK